MGDKEAIANLKTLQIRYPEMFKDKEEVAKLIERVIAEPEIIVDANRNNKNYEVLKAARRLDSRKMGDVVIKNENGTNEIFHANKKRIEEFKRLKNKENLLQVETPTPSTHQLNGLELMSKNSSGANALSANYKTIIPQNKDSINNKEIQTMKKSIEKASKSITPNNKDKGLER